ncbi:hypothetical protein [Inediibacterium massiliense]|uniref:hypothetical protein n=1 Tax=Inediibacterium massiliense TaxID=1658111 RepID=UPI0006B5E207|nr:hypothetical protein [Inediibacterium massiliense]
MKKAILDHISKSSLQDILDLKDLKDAEWIWINEEIFGDILYNLKLDHIYDEKIIDQFLCEITLEEMIKGLVPVFERKEYVLVNQYFFSEIEKGYKPTEDINTYIFVKNKYYTKMLIKGMQYYHWILEAMAIDTYKKMGTDYKTLQETYEELYHENMRIIEEILSFGKYTFLSARWEFIRDTQELYFYKMNEFYHSWSKEEVMSIFSEIKQSENV